MVMRSFLLFRGSQPGLFTTYQQGILAPSAFSPKKSGELRLPPLISREKDSGLPPVTTEKTSCPSRYCKLFDTLSNNDRSKAFPFGQQPVNYLLTNSVNHFVNFKDVLTAAQKRVYPCHHDVAGAFELAVTRVS